MNILSSPLAAKKLIVIYALLACFYIPASAHDEDKEQLKIIIAERHGFQFGLVVMTCLFYADGLVEKEHLIEPMKLSKYHLTKNKIHSRKMSEWVYTAHQNNDFDLLSSDN